MTPVCSNALSRADLIDRIEAAEWQTRSYTYCSLLPFPPVPYFSLPCNDVASRWFEKMRLLYFRRLDKSASSIDYRRSTVR